MSVLRTPTEVVAQVSRLIPDYLRSNEFGGRKVAVPTGGDPFFLAASHLEAARDSLLTLPDYVAQDAGCHPGWRALPLDAMLRDWGWEVATRPSGSIEITGIHWDVIFVESFAALAALHPHLRGGPMVFSGEEHGSTSANFYVQPHRHGLDIESGRQRETYIEYDAGL